MLFTQLCPGEATLDVTTPPLVRGEHGHLAFLLNLISSAIDATYLDVHQQYKEHLSATRNTFHDTVRVLRTHAAKLQLANNADMDEFICIVDRTGENLVQLQCTIEQNMMRFEEFSSTIDLMNHCLAGLTTEEPTEM